MVAYNNGDELSECCETLAGAFEVHHIVIVDNGFAEGFASSFTPSAILALKLVQIQPIRNLGYAAGNNLGIKRAVALGATRVLVCNPDVILAPTAVRGLLREIDSSNLDLVSPYLLEQDEFGTEQELHRPGWDAIWGRGVLDIGSGSFLRRGTPTFFGACFMATAALLNRVGPLSEDYFLYGEEVDYCKRMDRAGDCFWKISRRHMARHARGTSISPNGSSFFAKSDLAYQHAARSAIIVGRKHWPSLVYVWSLLRLALALRLVMHGRARSGLAVAKGVSQGWLARITFK